MQTISANSKGDETNPLTMYPQTDSKETGRDVPFSVPDDYGCWGWAKRVVDNTRLVMSP